MDVGVDVRPHDGPDPDRSSIRGRIASMAVLVALLSMVVIVNALWGPSIFQPDGQERISPLESPFPKFSVNQSLHVARIDPKVNYSTRLTLLSIQGLVNRDSVELYLDFENETSDAGSILNFISHRYGITYDIVGIEWVLSRYLQVAEGLYVYDPEKLESVNIGTMYAALNGWVVVGPDTAASLSQESQIPVLLDYSASDWSQLSAIEAYERALSEIYPLLDRGILAILPPERLRLRDYLIASRTFVFYHSQGALASPQELRATLRILHAAPRGIPIIGWFNSPTETEENLFVQMISSEGKYFVGGQIVPNLTVLSSLGRDRTFQQRPPANTSMTLGNKTYAVVAIADGDNLDYVTQRMRKLWESPLRGTFPIAWSLNPLLVDLAPAYLEYYYGTASSLDRFIASPSGAGYLYPDYLGEGDLEPFLEMSGRYLKASDMDVIWLLNSYPASEIQYSASTLSTYVKGLEPRGLVLDYDDQPTTRAAWMQAGGDRAAPVVRSTHLWTTKENFLGKVQAAMDSWDDGPHFLWMTVYPWRFDLSDAADVIEQLAERTRGGLEIVSLEAFFALLLQDFQERAEAELRKMKAEPLASIAFSTYLTAAEKHLVLSRSEGQSGDQTRAAYEAFLALESLQTVTLWRTILIVAMIAGTLVGIAAAMRRRTQGPFRYSASSAFPFLVMVSTMALFLLTLRSALDSNFWTYHFIFLGIALSGFAIPIRDYLKLKFPHRSPLIYATAFLLSSSLTLYTNAAFPLFMLAASLLLDQTIARHAPASRMLLPSALIGLAIGFLTPISLLALALLSPLILIPVIMLPGGVGGNEPSRTSKGAWLVGFAVSLPLIALATTHYYSLGLRLELEGGALGILGASLLVASAFIVAPVAWMLKRGGWYRLRAGALLLVAASAALLLFSRGTLSTSFLLLGMVTGLAFFAHYSIAIFMERGGQVSCSARPILIIIPLLLLFMRLPPLTYSLLFTPLPGWVEYALYSPQVIFAGVAIVMFLAVTLPHWKRRRMTLSEKHM